MSKNKKAIAFVICLFILVAIEIVYIFSELYNEDEIIQPVVVTDAIRFKNEFELLNNKVYGTNDEKYQEITISEDNPFVITSENDVIKKIDNKESFIIYFGYGECLWCRETVNIIVDVAKEKNIDKIYYVNIKDIRDFYELDSTNNAVRTIEGTTGYYELLNRLDNVLDEYGSFNYIYKKKTKTVKVPEKRIFAPSLVVIKDGVAVGVEYTTNDVNLEYTGLNEDNICGIKEKISCLFDLVKNDSGICSNTEPTC